MVKEVSCLTRNIFGQTKLHTSKEGCYWILSVRCSQIIRLAIIVWEWQELESLFLYGQQSVYTFIFSYELAVLLKLWFTLAASTFIRMSHVWWLPWVSVKKAVCVRGRVLSQLQFRDGHLLCPVILGKSFSLQEPLFLFL